MAEQLAALTDALLDAARKAGADAADALAVRGSSVSLDVLDGALEHAERAEGVDIGIRVLIGQRQACVSASDTRAETITAMAERAVAMAREAPEDPSIGLARPDQLAQAWDIAALELADPAPAPTPAMLEDDARRAEAAALAVDGISKVQSAAAGYSRDRIHLRASNGFSGGYERTGRSLACVAITGDGLAMERDYCGEERTFQSDLPSPEAVGRVAALRTLERSGPRKPKTGAFPVLFDERVAASLIGHLLQAINGAAIARGASWARDLAGEQVLPGGLSLIEEPHRARASRSRPFDAEGLPTARRALVENGRLNGWLLDLSTARRLGLQSTANAARATSAPPSPSVFNVTLTQGAMSREELMREMGTGLLVTAMIGASINPNTGDYSRGASGLWVENGAPVHPVNECTIAGNLIAMLKTIIPANDARPYRSRVVPSLLVEGLTLAGE